MHRKNQRTWLAASLGIVLTISTAAATSNPIRHRLAVELDPSSGWLEVDDLVTLAPPESRPDDDAPPIEFVLGAGFEIVESRPPLEERPLGDVRRFIGINADPTRQAELRRYRLTEFPENGRLRVRYAGTVAFELAAPAEEGARGFEETLGLVEQRGVYLAGSTAWYPRFDDALVHFRIDAGVPEGWLLISQGDGTPRNDQGRAVWTSGGAMDEIYLVGGPLTLYRESAGAVEAQVYLREDDPGLASKYLTATARYIEMYRRLIGPYPYGKFALVENFWDTGYGMPSFTLLGPRIIRFPFILTSSYPHEILHNWWGNSVFVDYASGNWCEGLTAYLADHLIQEQRGKGADYRRDALQRYRSYVERERDFPLSQFRARHSPSSEAVGYGKTLMLFHMLRARLGDDAFRGALSRLYRQHRGKRASFDDLRRVFESAGEEKLDLERFFAQWVGRSGAPALRVAAQARELSDGGWAVEGTLFQEQRDAPYALDVPLAIQLATGATVERSVPIDGARESFALPFDEQPVRLAVDPRFDLFRRLDAREVPPSIGQLFGDPDLLALLPSAASEVTNGRFRELLEGWSGGGKRIEVKLDAEIAELPPDRSVWIVGRENRFASLFGSLGAREVELGGEGPRPYAGHSIVLVRRHPGNPERAVGWLHVDPEQAFAGFGRKLPHYGKYSYLAFEGGEPTNVVKGQRVPLDSPMRLELGAVPASSATLPPLQLAARGPLAELPPVFSERTLMEHVAYLADPVREGRGIGTSGLDDSMRYIAARFEEIGLKPGGDAGGYLQRFTMEGPDGTLREVANVVGYLEGRDEAWARQSVVVGAHYDHLGLGWPDVHRGDEGSVHPGADDNASGVAVMLELARAMAEQGPPRRNLVFVAFNAEEAGRLGSRHFVEQSAPFPADGMHSMINLDTVGRLGERGVTVLGTGTADEWPHIFRGCGFVTGVQSRNVPGSVEASDQMSFIERGVPAVQIFTEAHGDYHRPSDTVDKVSAAGLVKVATFVKEAVAYLVDREEPLTATIDPGLTELVDRRAAPGPSSGRRVRFGTLPDFAYDGPGARIEAVAPGSPAERAGLTAGDVLLRVAGREIEDLAAFSAALRTLEPGQTVEVIALRGAERIEVQVTVDAR